MSKRDDAIAKHGHFRLPDGVDLKIRTLKNGLLRCVYTETFARGEEPAAIALVNAR